MRLTVSVLATTNIDKKRNQTTSAPTTPVTAPSVFQPYNRPSALPNPHRPRHSAATSSGSVAPMAVVGTARTANAVTNRTKPIDPWTLEISDVSGATKPVSSV